VQSHPLRGYPLRGSASLSRGAPRCCGLQVFERGSCEWITAIAQPRRVKAHARSCSGFRWSTIGRMLTAPVLAVPRRRRTLAVRCPPSSYNLSGATPRSGVRKCLAVQMLRARNGRRSLKPRRAVGLTHCVASRDRWCAADLPSTRSACCEALSVCWMRAVAPRGEAGPLPEQHTAVSLWCMVRVVPRSASSGYPSSCQLLGGCCSPHTIEYGVSAPTRG